jgi:NAD(P)-dependent dehydrogenase (short-subunit alcohol dehydrogenase family)
MASAPVVERVPRGVTDGRPAVLVTGASRGIGEACAVRLARDGFRVYAGVRREEDGQRLLGHGGGGIVPLLLDVTDETQIAAAAARVDAECRDRGLQALVNNAGVAIAGPLEFLPIDELRRQLDINFIGQLAVTQACLPLLRRSRAAPDTDHRCGRIVFMSSISGRNALPFTGAYAASKYALEAAADALRVELLPFGLRVVLVEPGMIATPIWDTSVATAERMLQRAPPQLMEFYGAALAGVRRRAARGTRAIPPEHVAEVVSRALTTRKPRIRYVIGKDARARLALQKVLPTRVRDSLIARAVERL